MGKKFYTFAELRNLLIMIRNSQSMEIKDAEKTLMTWIERNSNIDTLMMFADYMNMTDDERSDNIDLSFKKIHAKSALNLFN